MSIPQKAVEAAVQALFDEGCGEPKVDASTALEAAHKFIEARALRDTANRYRGKAKALREVAGITKTQFPMAVDVLLDLADELDRDAAYQEEA